MMKPKSSLTLSEADRKSRKKYRCLRSQHKWQKLQKRSIANPFISDEETVIGLPIFIPEDIVSNLMKMEVLSWPILKNVEQPRAEHDKITGLQIIKKATQYQQKQLETVKQLIEGRQHQCQEVAIESNNQSAVNLDLINEDDSVELEMVPQIETSSDCLFKDPTRTQGRMSQSPRTEDNIMCRMDHVDLFFH